MIKSTTDRHIFHKVSVSSGFKCFIWSRLFYLNMHVPALSHSTLCINVYTQICEYVPLCLIYDNSGCIGLNERPMLSYVEQCVSLHGHCGTSSRTGAASPCRLMRGRVSGFRIQSGSHPGGPDRAQALFYPLTWTDRSGQSELRVQGELPRAQRADCKLTC